MMVADAPASFIVSSAKARDFVIHVKALWIGLGIFYTLGHILLSSLSITKPSIFTTDVIVIQRIESKVDISSLEAST